MVGACQYNLWPFCMLDRGNTFDGLLRKQWNKIQDSGTDMSKTISRKVWLLWSKMIFQFYRAFIARAILKNGEMMTDISANDKGFYTSNYVYHQNKLLIGKKY